MVRYALDSNGSDGATKILIGALDAPGPVFRVGVVNSLARREGKMAAAALKKAAGDAQADVRVAAFEGLAAHPEPGHDSIIEKGMRGDSDEERRGASIARARLSETLRARGNLKAARQVAESILDSTAPEPQKKAARLTLERLAAS